MNKIALSLGTNIGNTVANMHRALLSLSQLPHVRPGLISSAYVTAPVGFTDQDDFLNLCCFIETDLPIEQFHCYTKQIESDFGRIKTVPNGPRIIDIDLLFLSSQKTVTTDTLLIPHPRLFERAFVLAPLSEITDCDFVCNRSLSAFLREAVKTQPISKCDKLLFGNLMNQFINHTL